MFALVVTAANFKPSNAARFSGESFNVTIQTPFIERNAVTNKLTSDCAHGA
jgi:hypothetical protein